MFFLYFKCGLSPSCSLSSIWHSQVQSTGHYRTLWCQEEPAVWYPQETPSLRAGYLLPLLEFLPASFWKQHYHSVAFSSLRPGTAWTLRKQDLGKRWFLAVQSAGGATSIYNKCDVEWLVDRYFHLFLTLRTKRIHQYCNVVERACHECGAFHVDSYAYFRTGVVHTRPTFWPSQWVGTVATIFGSPVISVALVSLRFVLANEYFQRYLRVLLSVLWVTLRAWSQQS